MPSEKSPVMPSFSFRKSPSRLLLAIFAILFLGVHATMAQPSKGFQILLTRGAQMQALSQWNDYWTYSVYSNANYSSVNWGGESHADWMASDELWSRWAMDETQMPPQDLGNGDEAPIM